MSINELITNQGNFPYLIKISPRINLVKSYFISRQIKLLLLYTQEMLNPNKFTVNHEEEAEGCQKDNKITI